MTPSGNVQEDIVSWLEGRRSRDHGILRCNELTIPNVIAERWHNQSVTKQTQ